MSLQKKKSRSIRVDDLDFRYIISTSKLDGNDNYKLNITIQIAEGKGAILSVKGLVTRNPWLDISDSSPNPDDHLTILPNHIEKFIRKGLKAGWNPEEKGSEFRLELTQ